MFEEMVKNAKNVILELGYDKGWVNDSIGSFMSMASICFSKGDLESAGKFTQITAALMRAKKELFG